MVREDIIRYIADIYEEFDLSKFGFSITELCKKMEINLLAASIILLPLAFFILSKYEIGKY